MKILFQWVINSLSKWYRSADIYLHLAWIEPCGNTQIEAMAQGSLLYVVIMVE